MKEHGICAKCKKSVGCPYADDRIKGCKKFVLEDELELTNEELLRQCNTEQLAEWLNNKIIICAVCDQRKSCGYFINETFHLCPYYEGESKSWEVWLKQPHTIKE